MRPALPLKRRLLRYLGFGPKMKGCSRQDLHLHWLRSRRSASAVGLHDCWKLAERGGHAPHRTACATISLAKSPGSLSGSRSIHAPGRICTGTERILSPLPLRWATVAKGPGGRSCTRTGSVLSGVPLLVGLRRENLLDERMLPAGIAPAAIRFEAGCSDLLSYGSCSSKKMAPAGLAPATFRFKAGGSI